MYSSFMRLIDTVSIGPGLLGDLAPGGPGGGPCPGFSGGCVCAAFGLRKKSRPLAILLDDEVKTMHEVGEDSKYLI